MAPTAKKPETPAKDAAGKVSQVIGAVVDVGFPAGQLPDLLDAIVVTTREDPPRRVVLEVQQEVGDNTVRCIAMEIGRASCREREWIWEGASAAEESRDQKSATE